MGVGKESSFATEEDMSDTDKKERTKARWSESIVSRSRPPDALQQQAVGIKQTRWCPTIDHLLVHGRHPLQTLLVGAGKRTIGEVGEGLMRNSHLKISITTLKRWMCGCRERETGEIQNQTSNHSWRWGKAQFPNSLHPTQKSFNNGMP